MSAPLLGVRVACFWLLPGVSEVWEAGPNMRRLCPLLVVTVMLAPADAAAASSCTSQASGVWHSAGTWDCGEVPDGQDGVQVIGSHVVTVSQAQEALTLSLTGGGEIEFAADPTLRVHGLTTVNNGTLDGTGLLDMDGGLLATAANFELRADARALLNGAGTIQNSAQIVVGGQAADADTSFVVNDKLTISPTAGSPFGGVFGSVLVTDLGEIESSKTGAFISPRLENDGLVETVGGTLDLARGEGTSDGRYLAGAGTRLIFTSGTHNIGDDAVLDGDGEIGVSFPTVNIAAGADVAPATLNVFGGGTLNILGTGTLTPERFRLANSVFNSTRDLTPSILDLPGPAEFRGDHTVTLAAGATLRTFPSGTPAPDGTTGVVTFKNGADITLREDATLAGGGFCVDTGSTFALRDGAKLTVSSGAGSSPFQCSGGLIDVPSGSEIEWQKAGGAFTGVLSNAGIVRTTNGAMQLLGGSAAPVHTGQFIADGPGTSIEFISGAFNISGRAGGTGTVRASFPTVSFTSTATIDPAVLTVDGGGTINVAGTSPLSLGVLNIHNGTLNSTRPIAPAALDLRIGELQGDHTMTVEPGATFTKTTGGLFTISGADLVLDAPASIHGGFFCVEDGGAMQLNAAFTIESTAAAHAFACASGALGVNAPNGRLFSEHAATTIGPPTTTSSDFTVPGQRSWVFENGLRVLDGTTTVEALGTFFGTVTLDGGVLTGGGSIGTTGGLSGNVVNNGGVVAPGSSPGTLTVANSFTQGDGGVLDIDVEGPGQGSGFDFLDVGSTATLDGDVRVIQGPGLDPAGGSAFQFLEAGSVQGTFDAVVDGELPGGKFFALDYPASPPGARLLVSSPESPSNLTPPAVTGTPAVGQTLTCDKGTWTPAGVALTVQWLRDGTPIAGQTGDQYLVTAADQGTQLACRVTATNATGSASATSDAVRVPAAVNPTPTATPTPTPAPSAPATTPAPTPRPTAEQRLAALPPDQVAGVLGLPSARRCISRRTLRLRIKRPQGITIRKAAVSLGRKALRVRKIRGRFTVLVDLRGLPKGRFTVRITVTTATGARITGARRYKTCARRERGSNRSPV